MTVHVGGGFTSQLSELPRHKSTYRNLLTLLSDCPSVSVFDFDERNIWLLEKLERMVKRGLLTFEIEGFPWWRYELTEKGKELISDAPS